MAIDSVTNPITNSVSLFRPVPLNKLQQNLSQFYEQTSSYVRDQFEQLNTEDMDVQYPRKKMFSPTDSEDESPRLNPQGLGQFIDIRV